MTKIDAKWTDNENKFRIAFLKLAINFLYDNYFFNFGNLSFWQVSGIPVDSDPAPLWQIYENKLISDTKKEVYVKHIFLLKHLVL